MRRLGMVVLTLWAGIAFAAGLDIPNNTWVRVADTPSDGLGREVPPGRGANWGYVPETGKFYRYGGYTVRYSNALDEFDPKTGDWTPTIGKAAREMPPLPGPTDIFRELPSDLNPRITALPDNTAVSLKCGGFRGSEIPWDYDWHHGVFVKYGGCTGGGLTPYWGGYGNDLSYYDPRHNATLIGSAKGMRLAAYRYRRGELPDGLMDSMANGE